MTDTARLHRMLAALACLALAGCSGIGPSTVVPSRFDYTEAIGDSWKQQMLINLVKIRYGDAPVFLDVASVISQFELARSVNWAGAFNNQASADTRTFGSTGTPGDPLGSAVTLGATLGAPFIQSTQTFGAAGSYIDRPTITYTPLNGDKFTRTLMKPIPPTALLSLVQAGYPIDLVLRVCTHSVNGIRNRYGGYGREHVADPEFYPLVQRLRRIQDCGAMRLRAHKAPDLDGVLLSFRSTPNPTTQADFTGIRKSMGLDESKSEYKIAYGIAARDGGEIAMLTRSVLEVLADSASMIDVPGKHVSEKRVNPSLPDEKMPGESISRLIRILSSRSRPRDAFVAVPYRDHWFWIDDRDLDSKSYFSFLQFVFTLTDTADRSGPPLISVPVG